MDIFKQHIKKDVYKAIADAKRHGFTEVEASSLVNPYSDIPHAPATLLKSKEGNIYGLYYGADSVLAAVYMLHERTHKYPRYSPVRHKAARDIETYIDPVTGRPRSIYENEYLGQGFSNWRLVGCRTAPKGITEVHTAGTSTLSITYHPQTGVILVYQVGFIGPAVVHVEALVDNVYPRKPHVRRYAVVYEHADQVYNLRKRLQAFNLEDLRIHSGKLADLKLNLPNIDVTEQESTSFINDLLWD